MPIPLRYYGRQMPMQMPMQQMQQNPGPTPAIMPVGQGYVGPPVAWSNNASANAGTQDAYTQMQRQFDMQNAMRWAPVPNISLPWPEMDEITRRWHAGNGRMAGGPQQFSLPPWIQFAPPSFNQPPATGE